MSDNIKTNKKPVILITGYLGSGKTTVMNELLKCQSDKKFALIVNDMGSINIDASLLRKQNISSLDTMMVELQNGCICCTLRDEFMEQIEELSFEDEIEAILVEASGISNPSAIADAFLAYEDGNPDSKVFLQSVVSVVDAERIYTEFIDELENAEEIEEDDEPDIINLVMDQIEFCNIILLNKCDLVNPQELERVKMVLRQLQQEATIYEVVNGKIDPEKIMNVERFDYVKVLNSSLIEKTLAHENEHEHKNEDGNHEEYGISSFVYEERRPFQYEKFMNFVEEEYPSSIVRAKGYIWFAEDDIHVQLFEQAGRNATVTEVSNWVVTLPEEEQKEVYKNYPDVYDDWDDEYGDRLNQIVFIGKEYKKEEIIEKLNACLD